MWLVMVAFLYMVLHESDVQCTKWVHGDLCAEWGKYESNKNNLTNPYIINSPIILDWE